MSSLIHWNWQLHLQDHVQCTIEVLIRFVVRSMIGKWINYVIRAWVYQYFQADGRLEENRWSENKDREDVFHSIFIHVYIKHPLKGHKHLNDNIGVYTPTKSSNHINLKACKQTLSKHSQIHQVCAYAERLHRKYTESVVLKCLAYWALWTKPLFQAHTCMVVI